MDVDVMIFAIDITYRNMFLSDSTVSWVVSNTLTVEFNETWIIK